MKDEKWDVGISDLRGRMDETISWIGVLYLTFDVITIRCKYIMTKEQLKFIVGL